MRWPLVVLLLLSVAAVCSALWLLWRGTRYRPARRPTPLRLVVRARVDGASDWFTLRLGRSGWARWRSLPAFTAGQSVTLAIPGESTRRRYSLARWQAHPRHYEVTIKREAYGRFSPRLFEQAQVGALLEVGSPEGTFVLQRNTPHRRAVLVAGGVGITPLLAMLDQWCADSRGTPAQVVLVWQIRHEIEAIYRDQLAVLAQQCTGTQVHILVSRPTTGRGQRLDVQWLQQTFGALTDTDFYLCASPTMLDALLGDLAAAGVASSALHFERFGLGSDTQGGESWAIDCAGQAIAFGDHTSLLDALEAHQVAVDSDCRTGSCGRCAVPVLEGSFRYRAQPECVVAAGHVLSCCALPTSPMRLGSPVSRPA